MPWWGLSRGRIVQSASRSTGETHSCRPEVAPKRNITLLSAATKATHRAAYAYVLCPLPAHHNKHLQLQS